MTGAAAHDDSGGSVDSIGQVEKVESDYYAFMGFDRANAESVLSHYPAFFDDGPVLELACGPGVFLDLLAARGISCSGVDIDDGMVAECRANGHDVVLGDALKYLADVNNSSLNGLFAAHFLEHLPSEAVQRVYAEAARVLGARVACSLRSSPTPRAARYSPTTSGAIPRTCASTIRCCCSSSPSKSA